MATAPAKSPLHNFPLPFLKWGSKNAVNGHQRARRPVESPPRAPSLLAAENSNRSSHLRPSADGNCDGSLARSEAEPENQQVQAAVAAVGSRTRNHRGTFVDVMQRQRQETPEREREREKRSLDEGDDEYRVKVRGGEGDSNAEGEAIEAEAEAEESAQKPWNLRPRKATMKASMEIGGGGAMMKHGELHEVHQQMESLPKSMRLRGYVEAGGSERREKRRFWIALSKEEIEEDIYALTGSKPARRPRKRARNVQKQLDNLFPGLWLVGFSPEAYRGLEAPSKR
ncbi:hypothetical protein Ancab_033283 [Ancistrocladus abbreviatus]